ncbi:DsbA family oxidoreductase [Rothia aerolata]|uniref:DSBA oxidoreductase n=1 Tax=Rothia aerolata TaxID=1812262 RepID=A0A917IMT8_9MICC|nr:DsbA family oxidoreductase [Rothia aerolata]GGH58061.1 DSBA oxidoreductase [Rothia aerolata]
MKIEIWSDIVCPFCYIGKRHLELALEQFEHKDDVDIIWRSFELDPTAPAVAEGNLAEKISKKYGISLEKAEASQRDIAARAEAVGLTFNWQKARYGNTFDAHRMVHLAAQHGLVDQAEETFKKAYFTDGQAVGDPQVLRSVAAEIGLPTDEVEEVLASDKFADEVRDDECKAQELGISGVPFFLLEEKWAINGAQPVEMILAGLRQVWAETHPTPQPTFITVDGADAAASCGPNGC